MAVLIPLSVLGLMLVFPRLFAMSVTQFSGWGHITLSMSLWGYYFGIGFHGGAAALGSDNLWPTPPPSPDPPQGLY